MSLNVIGAGFGRTGTLSLKLALEKLGFGKAHHMLEVAKSSAQINHWWRLSRGEQVDWDEVLKGFQSTTDFPACVYYQELATRYPEAKVVLTVRDPDTWYRSVQDTILAMSTAVPKWLLFLVPPLRRLWEATDAIVWRGTFGGKAADAEHAKAVFRAHNAAVAREISAERLLVFEVKEGWGPLCAFLGVPEPAEPFPHVNDTAEMKRRIRVLRVVNWLPLIVVLGVLGWWVV